MSQSTSTVSPDDHSSDLVKALYPRTDMDQAIDWFAHQLMRRPEDQRYQYLCHLSEFAFPPSKFDRSMLGQFQFFASMIHKISHNHDKVQDLIRVLLTRILGCGSPENTPDSESLSNDIQSIFQDISFSEGEWPSKSPGIVFNGQDKGFDLDPDQPGEAFKMLFFRTTWLFDLIVVEYGIRMGFQNMQQCLVQADPNRRSGTLVVFDDRCFKSEFITCVPRGVVTSSAALTITDEMAGLFTLLNETVREDAPFYNDLLLSIFRYDTQHIQQVFQHSLGHLDSMGNEALDALLSTAFPFPDMPDGVPASNSLFINRYSAIAVVSFLEGGFSYNPYEVSESQDPDPQTENEGAGRGGFWRKLVDRILGR